jgi:hypothetical protein
VDVVVNLGDGIVVLREPEDTGSFALRVAGPADAAPVSHGEHLARVLEATGVGRLGPDGDAYVASDALRFMAAGQVDDGWDEQFESMLAYAGTRGWLDDDGAVQAHVVWPTGG